MRHKPRSSLDPSFLASTQTDKHKRQLQSLRSFLDIEEVPATAKDARTPVSELQDDVIPMQKPQFYHPPCHGDQPRCPAPHSGRPVATPDQAHEKAGEQAHQTLAVHPSPPARVRNGLRRNAFGRPSSGRAPGNGRQAGGGREAPDGLGPRRLLGLHRLVDPAPSLLGQSCATSMIACTSPPLEFDRASSCENICEAVSLNPEWTHCNRSFRWSRRAVGFSTLFSPEAYPEKSLADGRLELHVI